MWRQLLLARFALYNVAALAMVGWAALRGWLHLAWEHDTYYAATFITGVFLLNLVWCGSRVWQVSAELDFLARNRWVPLDLDVPADVLWKKLAQRVAPVRDLCNALLLLGLIGTVVGFLVAFSAADPAAFSDPSRVKAVVATLMLGMNISLYATLTGAVLHCWMRINTRLLEGGQVKLYNHIVELREGF